MNPINNKSTSVETDWKKHIHSLPNPDLPTPVWLQWLQWLLRLVSHLVRFVLGIIVIFMGGFLVGGISGMGVDDQGAIETYILLGIMLNLSIGSLFSYFNRHREMSVGQSRIRFYTFTLSAWVLCLTIDFKIIIGFLVSTLGG